MLYIGIAVVLFMQLLHYFSTSIGTDLTISIALRTIHILAFAFELLLLQSVLAHIMKDNSFAPWFGLEFVVHLVNMLVFMWLTNFAMESYLENRTLFVVIPSTVGLILQFVIGIKFFLLEGRLAVWFKIYAGLFLLHAVVAILGTGGFSSGNVFFEAYFAIYSGLNFAVSICLALIFFQAVQELDREDSPKLSDDILDIS